MLNKNVLSNKSPKKVHTTKSISSWLRLKHPKTNNIMTKCGGYKHPSDLSKDGERNQLDYHYGP